MKKEIIIYGIDTVSIPYRYRIDTNCIDTSVTVTVTDTVTDTVYENSIERENEVAEITKYYEDNIGMITPASSQLLLSYLDDGMDYRLIIEAIKIATLSNNRNAKYINGILRNWKNKNYKVLADLENENKSHKKQETEEETLARKLKELEDSLENDKW